MLVPLIVGGALASGSDDKIKVSTGSTTSVSNGTPATNRSATTTAGRKDATVNLGDTLTIQPAKNTVTAVSYESPVTSANRFDQPKAGNVFAAVEIKGCAGPDGDRFGYNPFDFKLQMADDTRVEPALSSAKTPQLHSDPLAPNDCVRGWVTFEIPGATKPVYVVYTEAGGIVAKWRL